MRKIKGVFQLIWFLIKTTWQELRKKRTWIIVGFILWTYLIAWFNSNYMVVAKWKFGIYPRVTPIKNERTVTKVEAQEPKPVIVAKTEEEIVKGAKHGEELWNIYMLESTRGKNDGCRKDGKWGGFGVMSLGTPACYESFEKAVERASYWYEKIRKDNDLATSVCIWNLGIKQPNCMYYQKYISL